MAQEIAESPTECLDVESGETRQLTSAEVATVAKALGHSARLQILELFHVRCPRTVGDIAAELPLAQSTVSSHLRILREADLLRTLPADVRVWHCLNRSVLVGFTNRVNDLARRATT